MKNKLLILVLLISLSANTYALSVGDILHNEHGQYKCLFKVLYASGYRRFGAIYDYKTDKPYHCKNLKKVESTWSKNSYIAIEIIK